MPATGIHHIGIAVHDLDSSIQEWQARLENVEFTVVDHPTRGASVAHAELNANWLVLVCPADDDSVPGRYLRENGEGVFLLSLSSDDLQADLDHLIDIGLAPNDDTPRPGILDWQVADIAEINGVLLHLTDA